MANFKFGDRVKTNDGREAVVQEDQEIGSSEVKLMFEGEDSAHVVNESELQKIEEENN
ncbi:hypothetical protein [Desertivirga brevis]|uniref:hypothetical protein n=1 Tax=Desertivirga brevis TaxID=2810310 RepID=UPI001A9794F4|nr:hypothetical protein [Pedobacter sp. SYSU D00873]